MMPEDESQYLKSMLQRTGLFLSEEDIDKVRGTTFAIAGLGGVGAITAELLARWGVKRFRLLDMDRYEPSNLNRQLFATSKTLGQWKVDVAAERILEINPYAEIELRIRERVNNENVHDFVRGAGMVIQNADYPSAKLFYLTAREHRVPLVNGYATITGGRVQTFDYRNSPCRSLLESMWNRIKYKNLKPLNEMNEKEIEEFDKKYVHDTAPSLNFVTNMVGCLIVAEAIKLITGKGKCVLYPRFIEFDTFDFRMHIGNSNSVLRPENMRKALKALKKRGE